MIEISRNIAIGQYINNGSSLTRMDPRAKLICGVLLIALVSYVSTFTAFAVCLLCTSLIDLTDGSEVLLSPLERIGIPVNAFIMVLVIAFKFVPIFISELERLIKAQTARGVRFDQGNFIQRVMKLGPLWIPLFLSGYRRAEALSVAMEARCYGGAIRGWRRSKRRALHLQRFDYWSMALVVVFCAVTVLVNIVARY